MRVLIVESDPTASAVLELQLKSSHVHVYPTDLIEEAYDLAKLYDYDAVITEMCLKDGSGLELITRLRVSRVATPIIVLSGLAKLESKVKALNAGADDYLVKPCCKDELIARLYATVRRSRGHPDSYIEVDDLRLDLINRTVILAGERIHFTSKEYQTLELMAMRKGNVVSKDMFLNHLYGGFDEPDANVVSVLMARIRKKLKRLEGKIYIETVWGVGFCLRAAAQQDPTQNKFLREPPVSRSPVAAE